MTEIVQMVTYEKASGRILSSGTTTEPETLETPEIGVLIGAIARLPSDYVSSGRVVARPVNQAILDQNVIKGLPTEVSYITINGVKYTCNDREVTLEFDQPGTYEILVESWPHLDKEFTIEN